MSTSREAVGKVIPCADPSNVPLANAHGAFKSGIDLEGSQKHYTFWSQTYDTDYAQLSWKGPFYGAKLVRDHYPKDQPKDKLRILDIGCGTGLVGDILLPEGYTNIDGVDGNDDMLAKVRKEGRAYKNLTQCLITGRGSIPLPDNSYDIAVSSGAFCLGHVPPEGVEEFIRLVKPGGIALIVFRSYGSNQDEMDYLNDILAYEKKLEDDGKWVKYDEYIAEDYVDYGGNKPGYCQAFRVL